MKSKIFNISTFLLIGIFSISTHAQLTQGPGRLAKEHRPFVNYDNKNTDIQVVFESDKYRVFKKEYKEFIQNVEANSSYSKEKTIRFQGKSKYFIAIDNEVNSLPLRKKSIFKLFPNYKSEIKSFMKKNKTNLKEEEDLISVMTFISSIIEYLG